MEAHNTSMHSQDGEIHQETKNKNILRDLFPPKKNSDGQGQALWKKVISMLVDTSLIEDDKNDKMAFVK